MKFPAPSHPQPQPVLRPTGAHVHHFMVRTKGKWWAITPIVLILFFYALAAPATQADSRLTTSLFDPARHMRVSEVRPGMTGYGLTVFKGDKIEKFDVEVISVLKDFNPKYDVVLIRCKGDYLEHTGSIAGMSGSPVFLRDDAGHDRMIGAFAYGWPLDKDPVAGVQPIEYMLALPGAKFRPTTAPTTMPVDGGHEEAVQTGHAAPAPRMGWSLANAGMLIRPHRSSIVFSRGTAVGGGSGLLSTGGLPRLQPLMTPLMASGFSPRLLAQMEPAFAAMGMTLLQSGGSSPDPNAVSPELEPGSVLAVPLLTGDVDLTAIGTCTEVRGNRIFGFGHPFNNEGSIALPMGAGEIQGIIANLQTSFKLGTMSKASGTLTTDATVGVAGHIGAAPPTVPIDFRISYADGTPTRTYHFQSALHAKYLPMVTGMAFAAALTGAHDLPQYNTIDYDLLLEFADGQKLRIQNRAVNANPADLFNEIGIPITAASENPFQRVLLKRLSGDLKISAAADSADLIDITVPKEKYHPGDTLKAFATYKPFWGDEGVLPIEMDLPRDLPKGTYQLVISDSTRYVQDEMQLRRFRFTAETVQDVFAVLRDVAGIRDNALYVRLERQPDGVAIGRTALQRLPSSRRQMLLASGDSTTTPFVSSTVKVIPTSDVMNGSADFTITIETTPKIAVGAPHPAKQEPAAGAKAQQNAPSATPAPANVPSR